jgi:hypothetical protein
VLVHHDGGLDASSIITALRRAAFRFAASTPARLLVLCVASASPSTLETRIILPAVSLILLLHQLPL